VKRIVFSSDDLPAGLSEEKRRKLWIDLYADLYSTPDVRFLEDRQFQVNFSFTVFGGVTVAQCDGTVNRVVRSANFDAEGPDICYLIVNRSPTRVAYQSRSRPEIVLGGGEMTLVSPTDVREARFDPDASRYDIVTIPRIRLQEKVGQVGDFLYQPSDAAQPAARLLRHYLDILGANDELNSQPELSAHIQATLVDLVSVVLNGSKNGTASSPERGLRAARVHAILAQINGGFSDPAFSPETIARKLGLSTRYVQDLLTATGASFTERVLELRLRQAETMLANPRYDQQKISDIALACGFNDISYFNRCFRARFGCAPTQYRNGPRQV
jgi:AraC-like DNA-binding protein